MGSAPRAPPWPWPAPRWPRRRLRPLEDRGSHLPGPARVCSVASLAFGRSGGAWPFAGRGCLGPGRALRWGAGKPRVASVPRFARPRRLRTVAARLPPSLPGRSGWGRPGGSPRFCPSSGCPAPSWVPSLGCWAQLEPPGREEEVTFLCPNDLRLQVPRWSLQSALSVSTWPVVSLCQGEGRVSRRSSLSPRGMSGVGPAALGEPLVPALGSDPKSGFDQPWRGSSFSGSGA